MFVFDEPVAAEAFLILEDLDPRWELIEHAPPEAARLLMACASEGVNYIALNPPTALTCGEEEPQLAPVWGFIDHLLGE